MLHNNVRVYSCNVAIEPTSSVACDVLLWYVHTCTSVMIKDIMLLKYCYIIAGVHDFVCNVCQDCLSFLLLRKLVYYIHVFPCTCTHIYKN